jgi:hypothetical protein
MKQCCEPGSLRPHEPGAGKKRFLGATCKAFLEGTSPRSQKPGLIKRELDPRSSEKKEPTQKSIQFLSG